MPLYEYEHIKETGPQCIQVFEQEHSIQERLEVCPRCGNPVRKRVVRFGITENVLATSNLKEKGFQKWVRKDKGVYEKE